MTKDMYLRTKKADNDKCEERRKWRHKQDRKTERRAQTYRKLRERKKEPMKLNILARKGWR